MKDDYKMTFKDYMEKETEKKEPDIVKTVGDKGYDVKKAKVDPLAGMSYHDFMQYMPLEIDGVPRRSWQPIAEAVAKMFEDQYIPLKVDDDSEDNK